MNFLNKKVLLALGLLSFSGSAFGYVWTFTNLTLRPILIEFRLLAFGRIYYDIINPGENSSRFEWPLGSVKAGYCIDKFFIGELNDNHLRDIFGKATFPTAQEVKRIADDNEAGRAKLARVGKREPAIKWLSGLRWGTFDQASKDEVNALSSSVGNLAGEATNILIAAGTEVATAGSTAGAAGTLAAKLNLGKIFNSLSSIPGSVMSLAHKSPCASRHFDVVNDGGNLIVVTKD